MSYGHCKAVSAKLDELQTRRETLNKRKSELHDLAARSMEDHQASFSKKILIPFGSNSSQQSSPTVKKRPKGNLRGILKLNVGGKRMDLRRSTATHIPSRLAWICSGRWDHVLPRDKDGKDNR